jgi:hypothetical protein
MEKLGYAILLAATAAWLAVMIWEMVPIWPEGAIGLVSLVGLGLLFVKVLTARVIAARTDKYSKDVKK